MQSAFYHILSHVANFPIVGRIKDYRILSYIKLYTEALFLAIGIDNE